MRTTPHSWASIQAAADRYGVVFRADVSQLAGSGLGRKIKTLGEESQALIDEAEALQALADANEYGLKATDAARWDAIMESETGELAKVNADLSRLKKVDVQRKDLALANDNNRIDPFGQPIGNGGGYHTEGKSKMRLKDASTGREIKSYTADEPLADSIQDRKFGCQEEAIDLFGEGIRSLITGDSQGIQGAFTSSDSAGGFLVDDGVGSTIIDLARARTVALRAGAQTVTLENPETHLIQIAEDPTVIWRPELGKVPASDGKFKRISMRLKSLGCIVPISLELVDDARVNLVEVLTAQISAAMAQAIDHAILSGSGTGSEPKGIRTEPTVNTETGVGLPTNYAEVSSAIQKLYAANYADEASNLAWIANPRDFGTYDGLTASDGQPLQATPWASALQKYPTTSLPTNLGAGAESEMIVGDFSQVLLGTKSTGIQVRVMDSGVANTFEGEELNALSQFAKFVVVYMRVDTAIIRPNWMTVLSGVTAA